MKRYVDLFFNLQHSLFKKWEIKNEIPHTRTHTRTQCNTSTDWVMLLGILINISLCLFKVHKVDTISMWAKTNLYENINIKTLQRNRNEGFFFVSSTTSSLIQVVSTHDGGSMSKKIHSKFFHVYQCQYQSPVSVCVPDMEYVCQVDGYVALLCVAVEIGSVTYGWMNAICVKSEIWHRKAHGAHTEWTTTKITPIFTRKERRMR